MEYTTQTFKGEGYTVIIKSPILSDAERAKREQYVIDTLRAVYREVEHNEALAKKLLLREDQKYLLEENQNLAHSRRLQ